MHADTFEHVISAEGPFASVYFEDTHDTEDAAKQLELTWRGLRNQLVDAGAPDAVLDSIENEIRGSAPPVGRSGRGLVANAERILVDEHLLRPPPVTEARFSDLPYLLPVIEHGAQGPAYLVVAVDHEGADITIEDGRGQRTHTETVEGGEYPVHKAAGAETAGYGDPQPVAEEAVRRNIATVAHRVSTLTEEYRVEPIFLVGEVRSRTDLFAALTKKDQASAVQLDVGSRARGSHPDGIDQAVAEELALRRLAVIDDVATRFRAETGRESGLAAEGLDAVVAALRAGSVDTLLLGDLADRTVLMGDQPTWIATTPDELSELGSTAAATRRADEALPSAALATGSALVRIDERITPADGCAALLRFT
ncbi:hypothetical protein ACIGGF_13720 [Rhodococcus sp. NPDC078407]|uniref:Rv2629 family ribosome hibernation factor n=1 Tax=Rhodococcus sp. NPDC078407 TaxID=3364509 RepID=UPI0037C53AB3